MRLKSVTIALQPSYSPENAGKWVCQVQYASAREETSILLDDDAGTELLAMVGPFVAKRAAKAANEAAALIELAVSEAQVKRLPAIEV